MQWNELRSHLRHISEKDLRRVQEAYELGKKLHEGQKRRSGDPYFSHPIAVATMLAGLGADADTIVAALLHDTLEDTHMTLEIVEKTFGKVVGELVDGVTKLTRAEIGEKPSLDEQIETLRKIFRLMQKDVRIMVIKLLDRLHNMQTIEFLPHEKQMVMAKETMEVYVKIADRLSMQDVRDELESLSLSILEPARYKQLYHARQQNEERGHSVLKRIESALLKWQSSPRDLTLAYEHKRWSKLQEQIEMEGAAATGVASIIVSFVCKNVDECYQTMGILHQIWQRETLSFQDFINSPMINGYKGLHTTVILEDGTRLRCKIRTEEMHEYAHSGIASLCFRGEPKGLLEYLPWTKRISPLAKDTENHSDEFWQSLQSDVLGDSIIIHGASDEVVLIPQHATALDGAFYCYQNDALRITNIKVNGKDVPFNSPLENAASIQVELDAHQTVDRPWLDWVRTGLAIAKIRTALSHQSEKKKIVIGKQMLQELLLSRKKGFVEELDERSIGGALQTIGYSTLNDVYCAIADGRLDPLEVFIALFESKKPMQSSKKYHSIVTYTVNPEDIQAMDRVNQVHKKYRTGLRNVQYMFRPSQTTGTVKLKLLLDPEEQRSLISELSAAGAVLIHGASTSFEGLRFWLGITLLLLLWGLDPVVGYKLIGMYHLSSLDLSLVRFWSLSLISGLLLLWQRFSHNLPQARLPLKSLSLWLSVLLLLCISFATYQALKNTLPSHYTIPMTTAGVLLTTIVNKQRWRLLIATWALLGLGILLLILQTPSWTWESIVYTLLAVVSFSAFSIVSERYKSNEHIAARAAQYFFILSILCALLTVPLLPLATVWTLEPTILGEVALYVILFVGLPYYIYYYLLTHKQIDLVLRYSFLIIFASVGGQMLLLEQPLNLVIILSALLVIIGAALPLLHIKFKSFKHLLLRSPLGHSLPL